MSPDSLSPANSLTSHNSQQSCYFAYHPADHWTTASPTHSTRPSSHIRPEPSSAIRPEPSSAIRPEPSSAIRTEPSSDIRPDPNHPFLAARPAQPQLTSSQRHHMDVSKLMQLQSAAAHGSTNMSSRSSSSDSTRTSSDMGTPVIQDKSCSRCQTTYGSFIAYSLNSYYCTRCAKMTGYTG